jgi:hypothetical protein
MDTAMTAAPKTAAKLPEIRPRPKAALFRVLRAVGSAASFGFLALALLIACGVATGGAIRRLQGLLFGQLAWATAVLSLGWAQVMFREILGAYRKIAGFPWLASLSFAAAAASAVMAMHLLLS